MNFLNLSVTKSLSTASLVAWILTPCCTGYLSYEDANIDQQMHYSSFFLDLCGALSLVWWLLLWWAKFYALGALYFFISLWSSCKLWDAFQPPISQMLNCVLLSNYLQEVLVGQSPQVICVLHGNQTDFLFIFFSPPPNAKFQTDSILRSWPYPSLQLLILIDSNLSNPAFVAYTLLWRIKSCEWYPVSLHNTQFCFLSGFTPICDERGILLSNQGLHVRWLWWWILIYIRYSNYIPCNMFRTLPKQSAQVMCKNPICKYEEEVARLKPWFVDPSVNSEKNVLKSSMLLPHVFAWDTRNTFTPRVTVKENRPKRQRDLWGGG